MKINWFSWTFWKAIHLLRKWIIQWVVNSILQIFIYIIEFRWVSQIILNFRRIAELFGGRGRWYLLLLNSISASGRSHYFDRFLILRYCVFGKLSIICIQLNKVLRVLFHFQLAIFIPLGFESHTLCTASLLSLHYFAWLVLDSGDNWLADALVTFDFIQVTLIFIVFFWRVGTLGSWNYIICILILYIFANLQICFWSKRLLVAFTVFIHNVEVKLARFALWLKNLAFIDGLCLMLFHLRIPLEL